MSTPPVTIPATVTDIATRASKTAAQIAAVLGVTSATGAHSIPADWLAAFTAAAAGASAVWNVAQALWRARKNAKLVALAKWGESLVAGVAKPA